MKKFRERRAQINFPELEGLSLKKLFRMLRFTTFIFFLSLMQVMAVDSYAQMAKLSLNVSNERLEKVLGTIEDESEFFFLYNKDLIDVEQEVSVDAQNETIKAILDGILEGKDIAYTVYDRQIVLSNTAVISEMIAQQKSITGTITDEGGEPLPGVTVLIKGTTNGTVTNMDGNYTISNVPENATLQFSFIGMTAQEIVVGTQTSINVTLSTSSIGIDEVVAIGYGTVTRKEVTGAIGSVKSDDFIDGLPLAPEQILQGKVAGVSIVQASGARGAGSTVRIRGNSSISAGNNPLYVVDGVPLQFGSANNSINLGSDGATSPLSSDVSNPLNIINPSDIESIDVLKDASATAIYGSRGANGVIIITTKNKGRSGDYITYDGFVGFSTVPENLPFLNSTEYRK